MAGEPETCLRCSGASLRRRLAPSHVQKTMKVINWPIGLARGLAKGWPLKRRYPAIVLPIGLADVRKGSNRDICRRAHLTNPLAHCGLTGTEKLLY